jgi:hypothetical protein
MKRLFVVLVFLVGCGNSEEPDVLAGTDWLIEWTEVTCVTVVSFNQTGGYSTGLGCRLTDGSLGLDMETGSYTVSGTNLTTRTEQSTCPATASRVPDTVRFEMTPDNLRIVTTDGILIFERTSTGGPVQGGAVALGCFDDQGYFIPGPLVTL